MAGRKKQPLSVIQGKGRSNHLTKEDIKERQEHEDRMKGHTDKVEPPSYLTKKQKEEFQSLAEELMRLDIFSNLDVDNLARYIDSKDLYVKVTKDLRSMKAVHRIEGYKVASDDYAKITRVRNSLFNECKAAASELGLSISSRLKLVIPNNDEGGEPSEFDKKFGDV